MCYVHMWKGSRQHGSILVYVQSIIQFKISGCCHNRCSPNGRQLMVAWYMEGVEMIQYIDSYAHVQRTIMARIQTLYFTI